MSEKLIKKALIFGITGQDGAYLTALLLEKGYEVHGVKRRSSQLNTNRIDRFYQAPQVTNKNFFLYYGDVTDGLSIYRLLAKIKPDEVYNLAAMSHVKVSFELPEYTANVNALGSLKILEGIKTLDLATKYFQASTSELYGKVQASPQNEHTPFYPRSPYATAKLFAYWTTVNYREAYGIFASNGILFNHESPLRGETFISRKVTRAVASILTGQQSCLYVGNLGAKRDWGHAKDYTRAMWQIMQNDSPDDYVVATGKTYSVRHFIKTAFQTVGITLAFKGEGENEVGLVEQINNAVLLGFLQEENQIKLSIGQILVRVDAFYFRPNEVDCLKGDARKIERDLGWKPQYNLQQLINEMIKSDIPKVLDRI